MLRLMAAALAATLVCAAPAEAQAVRPEPAFAQERTAPPADSICADATTRAPFVAGFEGQLESTMGYARALADYREQYATWKADRMVERGVWTQEQGAQFAMALLSDDAFMGHQTRSMTELQAMIAALGAYSSAHDSGDEAGACTAGVDSLEAVDRMISSVEAQWAYLYTRYDAESRARGVEPE